MEFRVLGYLEIRSDGEALPLGSSKQRSLLALLLLNANHVVSTDRIIDELWGDEVGPNRQNALWVHVSNLRSLLEPDREKRSEGSVLVTRSPGYLLRVAHDELDAWRFEGLLQEARGLLDSDPAAAALLAGEGLALWRGRPYEDLIYESFTQPEISRLEELRLEAVELRIDADLRQGQAATLVGELESLVRQHPLREAFTADLMVALHRSGRHAEALRAYQRLRAHLREEIGVEPSASLAALEHKLIVGDPSLDHPGSPTGSRTPLAVRGYELREPLGERRFGRAYRAYQPAVGREVTVVVSRPEQADDPAFIRRFEADAELVARLAHPHVVPVYDYWREPGAAYLVTPMFRRGNLADLEAEGPLDARTVARLAAEIGSALAFAHQRGVVHRALTPASVQIDDEHHAFVGDFDLASGGELDTADQGVVARRYGSPEQLAGGAATARSDIYSLAVVLAEALAGRHDDVAAILPVLSEPLRSVIARATSHDPSLRYPDAEAFTSAALDALGRPQPASPAMVENPYKGLRSFDEADAGDFFGRERVVERLLARLGDDGSRGRFVAVVGPSGSGKSSVVRAGLLPALRRGALPGSADWYIVTVAPGAHPYEELEAALLRVAVNPPATLLEQLTAGSDGIRRAVRRVLPDERLWLLVVLDQFEELFTQTPEPVAHRFLNALAAAVEDPRGRLRVVATLRADCYDRPLQHLAISELVRRGTEVITPMTPNELERAIDGPAERLGVRFEPGLVAEMVTEVADRPGALPLLQYSLTELFDRREGAVVSASAYHETGGVSGALARRAEALFNRLPAPARETTRQVMLRLVTFGESGQSLRRRVQRLELTALGDGSVDAVLDSFGEHRLLSFDRDAVSRGPTVEIAHEALLTEWGRLRSWIDETRDGVRHQRRLAVAAAEWDTAGRDPGYLLTGPALDQMTSWAGTTDLQLHPSERAFLEASAHFRDSELVQDAERRRREERLRKGTRQRTRLLLVAGVVLALLASLTAVAIRQRNHASDLTDQLAGTEEARRLAAAASDLSREDPQLALLIGLEAIDASAASGVPALPEAMDALHWAIQSAHVPYPVSDASPEVRGGPTGRTGIYRLPLAQLVGLARSLVTRTLTPDECSRYGLVPCPGAGSLASPGSPDEVVALPREATTSPVGISAQPLAGTTVTVMGAISPNSGLAAELKRFQERTGIQVQYRVPAAFERELREAEAAGDPPDIAWLSQPTLMFDHARQGKLIDLSNYLDQEEARQRFGDHLVDTASLAVGFYGLPVTLDVKGLVWYPVPEFEQAGYTVPTTWAELIALSRRMVADGRTPWCMGWEDGSASGSPGTDWIEGLLLRSEGVGVYDRWAGHEIPFDDPAVVRAASLLGEVAFGDDFVVGGADSIATTPVGTAADPMFAPTPRCWLHYEGNLLESHLPSGARLGVDTSFFPLPPLQPGGAAPLFGGATFAVAYTDRPEVRELMRWIEDPAWGETWAAHRASQFLPANLGFDPARCGAAENIDGQTGRLKERLCIQVHEAVATNTWRFDASDLMPPEVGGITFDLITLAEEPGRLQQGMLDYITLGPASLDRILARIEFSWPT
ncbi:MAG: extracellular solute-binding protein [Acidimicrobiia bacterium]